MTLREALNREFHKDSSTLVTIKEVKGNNSYLPVKDFIEECFESLDYWNPDLLDSPLLDSEAEYLKDKDLTHITFWVN